MVNRLINLNAHSGTFTPIPAAIPACSVAIVGLPQQNTAEPAAGQWLVTCALEALRVLRPLLLSLLLTSPLVLRAQSPVPPLAHLGGRYYPAAFSNWEASTRTSIPEPGVFTVQINPSQVGLVGNASFPPVVVGVPIAVQDGPSSELVTPTSSFCDATGCQLTANFAYAHPGGFQFTSANLGLNEAIHFAATQGGGTVAISSAWRGSTAEITQAAGAASVTLEDLRAGNDLRYTWTGTAYALAAGVSVSGQLQVANLAGVIIANQFCAAANVLDQTCIQGALAEIGSAPATLFVPSGNYAINANLTIPSNVTLQFARGAVWTVAVPFTVQINGPLLAGNYQIFSTAAPASATGAMTNGSSALTTSGLTSNDVGARVYVGSVSGSSYIIGAGSVLTGYGNGTQTTWTFTASKLPLTAGTVEVVAGGAVGTDNGSGAITTRVYSSGSVTGTVNYSTGAISVTFGSAPANGTIVEYGYSTTQFGPLAGTITAVNSGTSATVSFTAAQTVAAVPVVYGGSYVKFGAGYVSTLNPSWWGAVGDGLTNSTLALQAAMTSCGQSQLPLSIPAGTYEVSQTLDAGDPFQLGIYSVSGQMPGQCSIIGQEGGADFGNRTPVVFQAMTGFAAGTYVLQRENPASVEWRNFTIDDNGTGANGIDGVWWEVGSPPLSPATSNQLINVDILNYGRMGLNLDNWNDAAIRDDMVGQPTGPVPIAVELDGGGGKVDLYNLRTYGGVTRVDAQNGSILGGGFYDGLEITGQSLDDWTIQGVQIFANAATGIALNSTSVSAEGTESVTCTGCWLTLGGSQVAIAGRWGRALRLVSTALAPTSGTPSVFGAISSGLTPAFYFYDSDNLGVTLNTPAVGNVYTIGGYNTSALASTTPFQFESLTAPTTGFLCLGNGACNSTTNFALGSSGTGLTLGAGYSGTAVAGTLGWGGGPPIASSNLVALYGAGGLSAGTITLAGGSGSHTFSTAYAAAPVCTATDTTTAAAVKVTSSTTAVAVTGTGTDVIAWQCVPAGN